MPVRLDRRALRDDMRYRVLQRLERTPEMSQREMSHALCVSLGTVHACLRGLIDAGLIDVGLANGHGSPAARRGGYRYVLTEAGRDARRALGRPFLGRRRAEIAALRDEIAVVEAELTLEAKRGRNRGRG